MTAKRHPRRKTTRRDNHRTNPNLMGNLGINRTTSLVLRELGCITIPCQYSTRSHRDVSFYIVDVEGPAILRLPDIKAFKIVTIHHAIDAAELVKCTKDLVKMYPKQFDGIADFKGEYHMFLDKDAQPVVHAKRKTPIQLKDEIEAELANMMQEGIIRKVEQPTDWVNSLAYSRKSYGKLRICLDPKDVNRYIKRDHHHTPTLEEITHKLSGSTVFSKMDAKHGYWSVKLNEESQLSFRTFQPHAFWP